MHQSKSLELAKRTLKTRSALRHKRSLLIGPQGKWLSSTSIYNIYRSS